MSIAARIVIRVIPRGNRIRTWQQWGLTTLVGLSLWALRARAAEVGLRGEFRVKYVASGAVYLEGGRNVGLAEGMKLSVKRAAPNPAEAGKPAAREQAVIGQVRVLSVAQVSAVCEIMDETEPITTGDLAYLEPEEAEALAQQSALA